MIVDFHAEATAEKIALGYHLDGRASASSGTHTHVQTADERLLPRGTAYLTDAGMTGVRDSVIGTRHEIAVRRFSTRCRRASSRPMACPGFCGALIEVDDASGMATGIDRLQIPLAGAGAADVGDED